MFNNFSNWSDLYKNQQEMMKYWTDFYKTSDQKQASSGFAFPNFGGFSSPDFFKQQKQMMEMWKSFSGGNFENFEEFVPQLENWQELMKSYNPLDPDSMMSKTASEVFEKMMDSNMFYLNLYKAWESMNKEFIDPQSEEFKKELEKAMETYDKMVLESFIPLMPEEVQGLFLNPYNYIKTLTKSFGDFYGPWTDISKSIADTYVEGMLTDPSKLSDTLKLWKEGYDKTFGALMKSPAFGISREAVEQNSKMIDSLISFLTTSSEFFTNVGGIANTNSKEAFEKYFELIKEGAEPKTFNEFYKFWSSKVEDALNEYFYTDEFAKIISTTVDAAMEFKIESDKATEQILENYPIVTKSEIDGVYKNVYTLKKEVKTLTKEINELKETIKANKSNDKGKESTGKTGK